MFRILLSIAICALVGSHLFAQSTSKDKKGGNKAVKTSNAPQTEESKLTNYDRLYKADKVTILIGRVVEVRGDSVVYYPATTPGKLAGIATSKLVKIVFSNGETTFLQEKASETKAPVVVEEIIAPKVILDEITLKNGSVISGRISSQQLDRIGYRSANSLDSEPELYVASKNVWKVKYGLTGQEVLLNTIEEKSSNQSNYATKGSKERKGPVYKKFKIDLMAGYSHYLEEGIYNYGFNFSIEPKYNVLDNLAVGLKVEAVDFRLVYDSVVEDFNVASAALSTEYYLGKKVFRPFFGMSVGYYLMASTYNSVFEKEDTETREFGGGPKLGFQVGHFRFATEMNFTNESVFVCLKVGGTIGGGKRK